MVLSPVMLAACSVPHYETSMASYGFGPAVSEDPYAQGKQSLVDGNPATAIEYFRDALRDEPKSVAAMNGLAIAYDELGRYDTSETLFRRALSLDPNSVQTLNNFGRSLQRSGQADYAHFYLQMAKSVGALQNEETVIDENIRKVEFQLAQNASSDRPKPFDVAANDSLVDRTSANTYQIKTNAAVDVPYFTPVAVSSISLTEKKKIRSASIRSNKATFRFEISNGNGRNKMAFRLNRYLQDKGFPSARLTNAASFDREETTIYYKISHKELAVQLAKLLPGSAKLVVREGTYSDVQVIFGHDLNRFDSVLLGTDQQHAV